MHWPSTSPSGHDGLVAAQRSSTSPLRHDGLVEGQCIAKRITRCRNSALQADIPKCSLLVQNEESVSHGLSMVPTSGEQHSISLQQLIGLLLVASATSSSFSEGSLSLTDTCFKNGSVNQALPDR